MASRSAPQLNIRLDRAQRDILDAAAFVYATTATRIAQDLLQAAIDDYARQPNVQAALQARLAQASVDDGKVARLRTVGDAEQ